MEGLGEVSNQNREPISETEAIVRELDIRIGEIQRKLAKARKSSAITIETKKSLKERISHNPKSSAEKIKKLQNELSKVKSERTSILHRANLETNIETNPLISAYQKGDIEIIKDLLLQKRITPDEIFSKSNDGHSFFYHFLKNDELKAPLFTWLNESWNQEVEEAAVNEFGNYMNELGFEEFAMKSKNMFSGLRDEIKNRLTLEANNFITQHIANSFDLDDINFISTYLLSSPSNETIQFLVANLKNMQKMDSNLWQIIDKAIERYEQISKAKIEKEDTPAHELLQLAIFIEYMLSVEKITDSVFKATLHQPRKLILEESGYITIVPKRALSLLNGEGSFKKVKNATRLPIDRLSNLSQRVAYARTKRHSERSVKEFKREWDFISRLHGVDGIIQGHLILDIKSKLNKPKALMLLDMFDTDLLGSFDRLGRLFKPSEKISIAKQMISAVTIMHERGIINWDLKPENILFRINDDNEIEIVISDFGLAFDMDKEKSKFQDSYGTEFNSAPELAYGKTTANDVEKCKSCEVWAMGLILHALLSEDKFPYPNPEEISYEDYQALHKSQVADKLETLLKKEDRSPEENYLIVALKMLSFNPEDRISIGEASQEIEAIDLSSFEVDENREPYGELNR